MSACYRYEELRFPNDGAFDDFVDASYVLTMEGSPRRDAYLREMRRLRPTARVFIQINAGFRRCHKPDIRLPAEDLTHAFRRAARHALRRGYRTVAIFEDDVFFSEDCVRHRTRIASELGEFLGDRVVRPKAVFLGIVPSLSVRASPHIRRGFGIGTHAGIYSRAALERIARLDPVGNDIDGITNALGYKWFYHRPLAYQIYEKTDNQATWGRAGGPFGRMHGKCTAACLGLVGLDSAAEPMTSRVYAATVAVCDWLLPLLLIVGAARLLPAPGATALGGIVGYVAYRADPTFRCTVATEAFGVLFPLATIVVLTRWRQQRAATTDLTLLVGAAAAMLVFHVAYAVEKNALGLRK